MKHAEEIERFLNEEGTEKTGKKTNKALYAWMKREVKGLYAQCFQFAFDIAKKAERALQHELGNPELSYLQFGYLAGKEGLLAGEKLYLDIKRMEMAYHELNQREYELTKHVSLLQVDPLALLQLRATGRCTVRLPEALFDMDGPGHYFRRIKTVAREHPLRDRPVRQRQLHADAAEEQHPQDAGRCATAATPARMPRTTASATTSAACNPSSPAPAQNDSGLFETNLRDERYLPFENSGVDQRVAAANCRPIPARATRASSTTTRSATSSCTSATPPAKAAACCATARLAILKTHIDEAQAAGSVRLFSVRHEFPTEWAKFKSVKIEGAIKTAELAVTLQDEHFPSGKSKLEIFKSVALFSRTTKDSINVTEKVDGSGNKDTLEKDVSLGGLRVGKLEKIALPTAMKNPADSNKVEFRFKLNFDDNTMDELWMAVVWGQKVLMADCRRKTSETAPRSKSRLKTQAATRWCWFKDSLASPHIFPANALGQ